MKLLLLLVAVFINTNCKCQNNSDLAFIKEMKRSGAPKNPKWDNTKASICGLDEYCPWEDGSHYYSKYDKKRIDTSRTKGIFLFTFIDVLKDTIIPEPTGVPVYGITGAFIGVITTKGDFIATKRRDHLVGKPLDRELLENPIRLYLYVKNTYHI